MLTINSYNTYMQIWLLQFRNSNVFNEFEDNI